MTSPCAKWEETIAASISGGLPEKEQANLEGHLDTCAACEAYRRALRDEDEQLELFAGEFGVAFERLGANVQKSITRVPAPSRAKRPSPLRILFGRPLTAATVAGCCLAVIILGWIALGPFTLHAQVVKALKNASSLHFIHWSPNGGGEAWYEHGEGLRLVARYKSGELTVVENRDGQWKHNKGQAFATKMKKIDPQYRREILDVLSGEEFRELLKSGPVRRETVNGIECDVYEMTDEKHKFRAVAYVGPRNRAHRFEEFDIDSNGEMRLIESCDFFYDIDIPDETFLPDFGPGVVIHDGASYLDERFNPDEALFTQEYLGHIVAIHDVQRVEGGMVFEIASIRPTEETIQKCRPLDSFGGTGSYVHGDLSAYWPWERLTDGSGRGRFTENLARANLDGLGIYWILRVPYGDWPAPTNEWAVGLQVQARASELVAELEAEGKKSYKPILPVVALPAAGKELSLPQLADIIHTDLSLLESVMFQPELWLGTDRDNPQIGPDGEELYYQKTLPPSHISVDEFEKAIRSKLHGIYKLNPHLSEPWIDERWIEEVEGKGR